MCVDVDEAGRDDVAGGVDRLRRGHVEVWSDPADRVADDRHVGIERSCSAAVDDGPAANEHIAALARRLRHGCCPNPGWYEVDLDGAEAGNHGLTNSHEKVLEQCAPACRSDFCHLLEANKCAWADSPRLTN